MSDVTRSAADGATLCLPMFWPVAGALGVAEAGLDLYSKNLRFAAEAVKIDFGLQPKLATPNQVPLDLRTMLLRDYSKANARGLATVVDAPYAGHSAAIADLADGQSLMQTLSANGVDRLFLTDWKSATADMKDFDIDTYLAELNVAVDDLGGRVILVGLCQGGWNSAMYAARFPEKVRGLVLAGAPIDTDAGEGPVKELAHSIPMEAYRQLVDMGGGLLLGRYMLQGWKSLDPQSHYVKKYVDLYENIDDPAYLRRTETFSSWYENPQDLPGRWYLQAVEQLFKENRLAKGEFIALGKRLSLGDITCPAYLLAGDSDEITPSEQVFAAEHLLGTPEDQIHKATVPGGHIGLFMGSKALRGYWPQIAGWIASLADPSSQSAP